MDIESYLASIFIGIALGLIGGDGSILAEGSIVALILSF
jgi:hypothetical protein